VSRDVLLNYIKADSYKMPRFCPNTATLHRPYPTICWEQANEILKSTCNLEILGLKHPLKERELEQMLGHSGI
jgi:hypothetical protein